MKGPDFAFTRDFPANSLEAGASGYASIPTESSHNDWRRGLYIKVNGVECRMLPVKGYTNGFFLLGETEITEEFYYAVMGGTTSSSQLPMSNINLAQATSLAGQLAQLTYWNFSLPTREEWQFAAKGGNDSQGYNYAGSNNPDAVAWYAANSNGKKHTVKSKAPNELGFYDMSGNVEEWTSSRYSSSSSYCCGGSYNTAATGIYVNSNSTVSTTYNYDYLGFRLVCR
jgi:formylglycine-generating enzyme required for sulfatase activity